MSSLILNLELEGIIERLIRADHAAAQGRHLRGDALALRRGIRAATEDIVVGQIPFGPEGEVIAPAVAGGPSRLIEGVARRIGPAVLERVEHRRHRLADVGTAPFVHDAGNPAHADLLSSSRQKDALLLSTAYRLLPPAYCSRTH